MKVYIVERGEYSSYSDSGMDWNVHKVFATMESAQAYIAMACQNRDFDYDVTEEEVLP